MTSRFVGRPTRLAFVILASIAPVISLGDDGMHFDGASPFQNASAADQLSPLGQCDGISTDVA